ncbi:Chaperone protein DnaJ [Candidatus Hodgkinia cicadicola]|nr:Chaperone protein DnaJ [Candidatus Hodgkinia cicadicola]
MKSPYDTLGLNESASAADIRLAFKQLALEHHPDRNLNNSEASKRFKEINEAYTLLKDPKRRAQYDKHGSGDEFARHPFEDVFGGRPFATHFDTPFGRKLSKVRRRHIRLNCASSLYQLWVGESFNFSIATKIECGACKCKGRVKCVKCCECNGRGVARIRQGVAMFEQTCSACGGGGVSATERCKKCGSEGRLVGNGSVQFNVRPGTAINTTFKLEGLGEAGTKGARAGGLFVRISVNLHMFYSACGADLFCTLAASSDTVGFGGRLEFNTVSGTPLTVPSSTPADSLFVLRQRGLPSLRGGFGDLHVELGVYSRRRSEYANVLKLSKRTLRSLLNLAIKLNSIWVSRFG